MTISFNGNSPTSVLFNGNTVNTVIFDGNVVWTSMAQPVITTWPVASAIVYGSALSASTLSGQVHTTPGTFSWSEPTTKPLSGTQTYQVTFIPTNEALYGRVYKSISVVVSKKALTVTPVSGKFKLYGAGEPSFVATTYYTVSGFVNSDNISIMTGVLSRTVGFDVGNYAFAIGSVACNNNNYTVALSTPPVYFEIRRATMTLTLSNISVAAGGAQKDITLGGYLGDGDITWICSGNASIVSGDFISRTITGNTIGTSAITVNVAQGTNYEAASVGATATVTPVAFPNTLSVSVNPTTIRNGSSGTISASSTAGNGAMHYWISSGSGFTVSGNQVTANVSTGTAVLKGHQEQGTVYGISNDSAGVSLTAAAALLGQTIALSITPPYTAFSNYPFTVTVSGAKTTTVWSITGASNVTGTGVSRTITPGASGTSITIEVYAQETGTYAKSNTKQINAPVAARTDVSSLIELEGLNAIYDGNPHAVTGTDYTHSIVCSIYYNGIAPTVYASASPPTAAGYYTVTATVPTRPEYYGSKSGMLTIQANGSIELGYVSSNPGYYSYATFATAVTVSIAVNSAGGGGCSYNGTNGTEGASIWVNAQSVFGSTNLPGGSLACSGGKGATTGANGANGALTAGSAWNVTDSDIAYAWGDGFRKGGDGWWCNATIEVPAGGALWWGHNTAGAVVAGDGSVYSGGGGLKGNGGGSPIPTDGGGIAMWISWG